MKTKEFVEYVYGFYGKEKGLYRDFFGSGVTRQEIKRALAVRLENKKIPFDGDTIDREIVRDIILARRALRTLEHNVEPYMKSIYNDK